MDLHYNGRIIRFEKELNALDEFTVDFTSVLNKHAIKYVLVSGYVSILFGRSRSSEDIDIIMEKIGFDEFRKLWEELSGSFKCLNTENVREAYEGYLLTHHAIRFSRKGKFIPNIEIKFPRIELEFWTLKQRKKVMLNKDKLFISPIELQISFKLYLGSGKDIEDAKYLYELFKDKIDLQLLQEFNRKLEIEGLFNKYLK
jgi:hypothetical protein